MAKFWIYCRFLVLLSWLRKSITFTDFFRLVPKHKPLDSDSHKMIEIGLYAASLVVIIVWKWHPETKWKSADLHMTTVADRIWCCLPGSQHCFIPYCANFGDQSGTVDIQIENIIKSIHQICCLLFWNRK